MNGKEEFAMKRASEKGTAMLFAIIMVLVLSVMAASIMFLSQSETWSGQNYRAMTQTRYGAEAGVNSAANFLLYNYVPPAATAGTPPPLPAGYNMTVPTPAACGGTPCLTDGGGNPIVMSSIAGVPSNYPDGAQVAAFQAATNNVVPAGATNVNYTASAMLLSMVQITPYATITPRMIQTWKITAHGDIAYVRNAEAEVTAILETPITPTFGYAAFATNNGCAALSFTGNGSTDSYDSGSLALLGGVAVPPATFNNYGGNVGTNGNQTDSGSNVTINGSLSTPDAGISGVCTANNVTGFTGNSSGIKGGIIPLTAPVTFPNPTIPPPGTTNVNSGGTLPPGNYGDISLSGTAVLTLTPGIYNINSISESGKSQLAIAPDPVTGKYGPVIINVTGNNQSAPINLSGQGIANPTLDPSLLAFNYAGSGSVNIVGNGSSAAVIYAPNATADFKGNASFFGSVIAAKLVDVGNGAIHYDLKLKKKLYTVGTPTLNSFTWSRF
jgi:hypothetical protein